MWLLLCLQGARRRPGEPVGSKSRRQTTWPEPRPRRLRRADGASEGYSPRPDRHQCTWAASRSCKDKGGRGRVAEGSKAKGGRRGGRAAKVLELQGLSRRYGDIVALDDLSFTVREGQMFGFVGPNCAGKTTTMRIILGVLEPDAGEVRWRGRRVGFAECSRFGYMPEERGLYPKMRVRTQLAYLARLHGVAAPEAAADRWIERLGLGERAQ